MTHKSQGGETLTKMEPGVHSQTDTRGANISLETLDVAFVWELGVLIRKVIVIKVDASGSLSWAVGFRQVPVRRSGRNPG